MAIKASCSEAIDTVCVRGFGGGLDSTKIDRGKNCEVGWERRQKIVSCM